MNNIWRLLDHEGKIRLVSKEGNTRIGKVILIEDVDEDDDYTDECIYVECNDGIWAYFVHEIEKIELLD